MSIDIEASSRTAGKKVSRTAAMTATKVAVKTTKGRLSGWNIWNPNASEAYVQFYDAASAGVTVGTTTPAISLAVPPNPGGLSEQFAVPIEFETAITCAATTTVSGGTGPSTGLVVNLFYR